VKDADYPAIIQHEGSRVRGSLVTGLNKQDVRRLDIFEGWSYKREVVNVQILKDVGLDEAATEGNTADPQIADQVHAQTYVWVEDIEELEPDEWDFEAFKKDKMRAWMGIGDEDSSVKVDDGFADVDAAAAALDEDAQQNGTGKENGTNKKGYDPTGGRGMNGHITLELENERL